MERREVLKRIGSALALALTPGLTGCATVRGPDLSGWAEAEPTSLADQLRERMVTVRDTSRFPRINAWVEGRGYEPDLLGRMMATLWLSATFRDLPDDLRRTPEVQRWILDEAPGVARTLFEATELVEGLDAAERKELAAVVAAEPELLEGLTEGLQAHGAERGVEGERLVQVKSLADQMSWRVRHQSTDAVIDELVDRFDRVCRRSGVERRGWREGLAAELSAWQALELVADPDGSLARSAAEGLDEEAVVPLSTAGAHLGVGLRGEARSAEILHVVAGSPADLAGLRSGDRVTIDGRELDAMGLVGWLSGQAPGTEVELAVRRGSERLTATARLGAGPGDRIVVERPGAALRSREPGYTSAGLKVAGVGCYIMAGGGALFLVGVLMMVAGGTLGGFGAGLTIVGGLIVALGLLIVLLGLIIHVADPAKRREEHLRAAPAP